MPSDSYEKAVAGLQSTAASLVQVSEVILHAHVTGPTVQERLLSATSRRWFEKSAKFVLNWLTLGQSDILREVRDGLRRCIGAAPAHRDFLARFSVEERAVLRAAFLEEFLSTYDFSFNRARFSEILGARRQDWRRALIRFHGTRRSLTVGDLTGEIFQNRTTADAALGQLEKLGLLQREPEELYPGRKFYVLTTLGRAAASMAREIEEEADAKLDGGLRLYEQPKHQPTGVGITLDDGDRASFPQ